MNTTSPATRRRRIWRIIGIAVGLPLLMLAAAGIADFLQPDDWRPVEATVTGTHIERTRPGTPQWTLMVDVTYRVADRAYESRDLDMFSDPERGVTEAERTKWPAGRTVSLHYDATDPRNISRWQDGGREAAVVLAALLVPVLFALAFLVISLRRR